MKIVVVLRTNFTRYTSLLVMKTMVVSIKSFKKIYKLISDENNGSFIEKFSQV